MTYCWDAKAAYLYESSWSISHKVAYWNACDPNEIALHFKKGKTERATGWPTAILRRQWFDEEKMANALSLPKALLENAFLDSFLFTDEIHRFTCHTLRFCPICIKKGFHSVIHQMLFWEKCPLHKVKIQQHCLHCRQPISIGFTKKAFRKPYSCPQCHRRLFRPNSANVWIPDQQFYEIFGSIGDLLKYRKQLSPTKFDLKVWEANKESNVIFDILQKSIFTFWKSIYFRTNDQMSNGNKIEFAVYESRANHDKETFLEEVSLYKAFKRRVESILKSYHGACFDLMKVKEWTVIRSGIVKQIHICPFIQAYLVWRQYWENSDKALYHFQKPYTKTTFKYLAPRTYAYSSSQWMGSHIFWEELNGTFLEALDRAMGEKDAEFINRHPVRLYFSQVPYWESYQDIEKGVRIFGHFKRGDFEYSIETNLCKAQNTQAIMDNFKNFDSEFCRKWAKTLHA